MYKLKLQRGPFTGEPPHLCESYRKKVSLFFQQGKGNSNHFERHQSTLFLIRPVLKENYEHLTN